jgi:2,5-furandicarboxylate decarboxylase 1
MKDLRHFIAECEKKLPKEFIRVTKEVDPKYEISAIVKKLDLMRKHPLLLFEKTKGHTMPVVCNTDKTMSKFGVALGVPAEEVFDFYAKCEEECMRLNKYPMKEVKRANAPCKEVIKTGKAASMHEFPFLTHHEGEVPYLTLAIGVANHEKANCPHTAHYRLMVKKPDLGVTHITPGRHLWDIYREKSDKNQPVEIAFVLGLHPAVSLAAQSRIAHPPSEFDVAGSLLREPLEVVRCETIDVLVPASAEIVIEGEIPPNKLEDEGPWRDFTRYHQRDKRHPVKIKAITHRKNPIVQDMGVWASTVAWALPRIPLDAFMNRQIKQAVPDVKRFRSGAPMWGFLQLDKKHVAQPKQAILATFANDMYLKYVVCFDTDIDLDNGVDMMWALSTRVQAERDVMILPGVLGSDLDLSAPAESVVTKVGVDATAKPFRKDLLSAAQVLDTVMSRINLKDYIGDPADWA